MNSIEMILTIVVSFLLTLSFLPVFIKYAHKKKQGQMMSNFALMGEGEESGV